MPTQPLPPNKVLHSNRSRNHALLLQYGRAAPQCTIRTTTKGNSTNKGVVFFKCSFLWFWDIFLDVFFYIIKSQSWTPNQWTSETSYKKTTYGLYQYRIISIHIWIISIQDYTHNERVKTSTIYHIAVHGKDTTTTNKKCNTNLLTSSPTMHHITLHRMKGQRQIISSYLNNHNLLNAERYTTDGTIPPYKTTSI